MNTEQPQEEVTMSGNIPNNQVNTDGVGGGTQEQPKVIPQQQNEVISMEHPPSTINPTDAAAVAAAAAVTTPPVPQKSQEQLLRESESIDGQLGWDLISGIRGQLKSMDEWIDNSKMDIRRAKPEFRKKYFALQEQLENEQKAIITHMQDIAKQGGIQLDPILVQGITSNALSEESTRPICSYVGATHTAHLRSKRKFDDLYKDHTSLQKQFDDYKLSSNKIPRQNESQRNPPSNTGGGGGGYNQQQQQNNNSNNQAYNNDVNNAQKNIEAQQNRGNLLDSKFIRKEIIAQSWFDGFLQPDANGHKISYNDYGVDNEQQSNLYDSFAKLIVPDTQTRNIEVQLIDRYAGVNNANASKYGRGRY